MSAMLFSSKHFFMNAHYLIIKKPSVSNNQEMFSVTVCLKKPEASINQRQVTLSFNATERITESLQ